MSKNTISIKQKQLALETGSGRKCMARHSKICLKPKGLAMKSEKLPKSDVIENKIVIRFLNLRGRKKRGEIKGSSVEFVGRAGGNRGVAHPVPNLLKDMWANTDREGRERQDASQEYSE